MVWIPYDIVHRRPATRRPVEGHRRVVQGRGRWQAGAAHHGRVRSRLPVPLPRGEMPGGVMPGSRHGGTRVAPFGLLPVQGLHPRARAARGLPRPWRQDGSGAVRGRAVGSRSCSKPWSSSSPRRSRWRTSRRRSASTTRSCGGSFAITWTRPGSTRTTRAWRPSAGLATMC